MRATNKTRKPTATPNGKTAGKTATKNNTRRIWRRTTRKGERVLVDPAGRIYRGTAQEVRDAGLTPRGRNILAQEISWARDLFRRCPDWTPEERREYIREKRMNAIMARNLDAIGESVTVPADLYLLLAAGARLVMGDGETLDDYFTQLFRSELDALLDVAQSETGKREIPMTRHERAAFARIAAGRVA